MNAIAQLYYHLTGRAICTPETLAVGNAIINLMPDDDASVKEKRVIKRKGRIEGKGLSAVFVPDEPKRKRRTAA